MGKSIWKSKLINQRRKALYDEYRALTKTCSNQSEIVAKLAVKYGVSAPTIYSDIKIAGGQANDSKRTSRNANR